MPRNRDLFRAARMIGMAAACLLGGLPSRAAPAAGWIESGDHRYLEVRPDTSLRAGFRLLEPAVTGVSFTNRLEGDMHLTNFVAHNGSGVAVGDVDADGLPDLYFCALQGPNRLFRNLGGWKFRSAAEDSDPVACADQFSTGAAFGDVDGDGDADLLVNGIGTGTRLFFNDGTGRFAESAGSGLSRTASATSLALADMDGDGDLDLYCAHYIDVMHLADPTTRFSLAKRDGVWTVAKVNGEPATLPRWKDRFEALPDGSIRELPEVHGLYRNDGHGRFTAIEKEPGTYLDEAGRPMPPPRDWGLAAMWRDWTGDGAPDLYVCNDNASPDRIWTNTGRGKFRAAPASAFRHTSRSSMAVDMADVNRDGWDDVFVSDMLSREHARRMMQLVRERPNPEEVERAESRPAFNRNTLFLGRPDGSFAEVALQSGVAATDWSWCPVFLDVDLDGYEDLLVNNGFDLDVMDQDSNDQLRGRQRPMSEADRKRSRRVHPPFRTGNAALRNLGDGRFEPMDAAWGFNREGVSHGAALGDFDNDGDLDVVVNNLNGAASLYRNEAPAGRVGVRLAGLAPNSAGIGARIRFLGSPVDQSQEMMAGGRYLSGDQPMRVFATGATPTNALRIEVRWRDGTTSRVDGVRPNRVYEIRQPRVPGPGAGQGSVPASPSPAPDPVFTDISDRIGHIHTDEPFDDWARQPLLPRRLSRLGPGVAWVDLDLDGWDDLVLPSGRGGRMAAFRNDRAGGFQRLDGPAADEGDQGSVVGWTDARGRRTVRVARSNFELAADGPGSVLEGTATNLMDVVSLPAGAATPGPMSAADVDGDGDLDLFVGGRVQPGRYPEPVDSALWIQREGALGPDPVAGEPFRKVGMVSGSTFADFDGDGDPDLALATEWGPVRLFENRGGRFSEVSAPRGLAGRTGWWTGVVAGDFDGDGRLDLAVGNWGRNSTYELTGPGPIRAHYGDWDGDGRVELVEAWSAGPAWYPVRNRLALAAGLPDLPIRFPTHRAFGEASLGDVLGPRMASAGRVEITTRDSGLLLNRGDRFEWRPFPAEAQRSPVFAVNAADFDGDGREDLFLGQNFFGAATDLSRDDGGQGLWLRGDGSGGFVPVDSRTSGVAIDGEQRGAALADFNRDGRVDLVVTQNRGATRLFLNRTARPGLRVVCVGPVGNPTAIGAQIRVNYANGTQGPCRAIQGGAGYWSQDSAVQVLGLAGPATSVWVRWPGGRESTHPVPTGATEVFVRHDSKA